ncbi:MAG: 1,4-alpha-glucan branching protein GlgB [Clostridiaceae bacterium]|nr:1,4-alpha-glucan branching protein GlgB [Clostridiaceae bacterium]
MQNNLPIYLFHQGTNYRAWELLGAHIEDNTVVFRVWAPNAADVTVAGDFNNWDKAQDPMTRITEGGVWELCTELDRFPPDRRRYKYCLDGRLKADPYAFYGETLQKTASILYEPSFSFTDDAWRAHRTQVMRTRRGRTLPCPINIYELHLGSWHTRGDLPNEKGDTYLNYREIADLLAPYLCRMGYTHAEIMPITEYPFDGSWGYQVCSYFAPTARYGSPEDFAYFVNRLHEEGIGVILDWVPAHFPKDAHGLYEFDGKPLYEYQGRDRMEHAGWGTRFFDVARNEVESFLVSSAVYWVTQYHVDGLRCDAVASMLYLDYDRSPGEWLPNRLGTNINLEAEAFLKKLNAAVHEEDPHALMIAEESASYPGVTKPVADGGLGFDLKWDMGFANDMFDYVQTDPLYRRGKHRALNFSMMYAFNEHYILPVSHDEVVHGKKSLIDKMFGAYEQKFAGLRSFLGFVMAHPGKKLTFMGCEFGQFREWDYKNALEWFLLKYPAHDALHRFTAELNRFYLDNPALWEDDFTWKGFHWLNADDADHNAVSFRRVAPDGRALIAVSNFSGAPLRAYPIRKLRMGVYRVVFNTDWQRFGGETPDSIVEYRTSGQTLTEQTLALDVPPLTTVYLRYKGKA